MLKSVLHFIFLLKMKCFKVLPPKHQIEKLQKTFFGKKKRLNKIKKYRTCLAYLHSQPLKPFSLLLLVAAISYYRENHHHNLQLYRSMTGFKCVFSS